MSVARSWRTELEKTLKAQPVSFRGKGVTGQVGASGILYAEVDSNGGCEFNVGGGQMNHLMRSCNDRDLADFGHWLVRMFGSS